MAYGQPSLYALARRMPHPNPIPPTPKAVSEKPTVFTPAAEKPDKPISTESGAGTTAFRPMPYVRGALAFGNIAYPGQVHRAGPAPVPGQSQISAQGPSKIVAPPPVMAGHPAAIPNALDAPQQPRAIPLTPSRFISVAGAKPRQPGRE